VEDIEMDLRETAGCGMDMIHLVQALVKTNEPLRYGRLLKRDLNSKESVS
jgi:hypothetical protein